MEEIPEVVILRLPLYLRALAALEGDGATVVSSPQLGQHLQVTPAQIRKDLSYFGRFGKQGRGYNVHSLLQELRRILGLGRRWDMIIVGMGRLGRAIAGYAGFQRDGFNIVGAFDRDPALVGRAVGKLTIRPLQDLEETVSRTGAQVAIVSVPAHEAQGVVDQLVACGIRGMLNYAPVAPRVPEGVWVRDIDPVVALQTMTYHLKGLETAGPERRPTSEARS